MTEPRTPFDWINLAQADDPRDVVHRAVASLAHGECVGFAGPEAFGLAASALRPEAVRVVSQLADGANDDRRPLTLLIRGADELGDWVAGLNPLGERLARRAWPGPVTLVFPGAGSRGGGLFERLPAESRACFPDGGVLAFQAPGDPFVRDVLKLVPGPVAFAPVEPPAAGAGTGDLAPLLERSGCRLLIEAGAGGSAPPGALVRVEPEGWDLLRPGHLDEAALARMAGTIILFVCTGNTCRSPMAEALCKLLLAERLGCAVGELEARGFVVLSAGIAAVGGLPAAAHAVEVVRARGGSLQEHQSRRLTVDLVRQADLILAMTADHLDALLDHVPEAAAKTRLLHPAGDDVADPVGADRETYLRTAQAIEAYLSHLLSALGV